MSKPSILITGASGSIGTALVTSLAKQDFRVIAGVSGGEKISDVVKQATDLVIELDYDSSNSVQKAFLENEIDYLFLIPSKSEERALEAKRLIAVGIENKVKYIVLVSLLDCHARTGILAAQFRYIEQYIEATGVPYTILRSAPLQQNFLDFKTGRLTLDSPIHARDIAAAAKIVLGNPKAHYGKTYRLTGPELLTGTEIAGKASMGLGRPVRFVNRDPPMDAYKTTWAKILDMELYGLIKRGFFTSVSSDVYTLTGQKGITMEQFFAENEQYFNGDSLSAKASL
ncbi:hypothetical protein HDU91_003939 [Kappamyces sp. JEL0680]|nr:hypothetical protein HDU91_003939 [Kappamyces sp. JEL0680]